MLIENYDIIKKNANRGPSAPPHKILKHELTDFNEILYDAPEF